VALCERATRAGLEVALEREWAVFVRELHGDDQLRGPMLGGVMAAASVVPCQSSHHVAGHTCVEALAIGQASKSVDKALGHAASSGNANAAQSARNCSEIRKSGIHEPIVATCDTSEDSVCYEICDSRRATDLRMELIRTGPPQRLRRSGEAAFAWLT
jgi:hypothetical protein